LLVKTTDFCLFKEGKEAISKRRGENYNIRNGSVNPKSCPTCPPFKTAIRNRNHYSNWNPHSFWLNFPHKWAKLAKIRN